jgi:hypothetical protein
MGLDHRNGWALGSGQDVTAFSEYQRGAQAGEQKQQSTVHREFLSNGAARDQRSALMEFRKHDEAWGSIRF